MSRRKKSAFKDPHFQREQAKYSNPIASREFIIDLLAQKAEPLPFESIRALLKIDKNTEECEALKRRLRAMERDGQVIRNRKLGYGLIDKMDLFKGRVVGRKEGDGILVAEDKREWALSAREMRKTMHGDVVLAREESREIRGRREAKIIEIIDHQVLQVVGRYQEKQALGFVIPDDKRIAGSIQIPDFDKRDAKHGQVVVVAITQRPSYHEPAIGTIIEVLGEHMAPGMEIEIAIRNHDLPHRWPEQIDTELAQVPFDIPKREYQHRKDLRDLPLVTIDGEDAKDFDDAVYCQRKKGGGWRLWVAIADVSFYVQPHTALDEQASERGTSVYFPGQVIPMLPEVLSNGVCSLKPMVERRCMICEMTVSEKGKLSGYQFYPAVMKSHARLTYTQVAELLEKGETQDKVLTELLPNLQTLHELYKVLRKVRIKRGALEFESQEPVFLFSETRKIENIVLRERNDAHKIIEECMILANISAARFLAKHQIKALVRNHHGPTDKKLANLKQYLGEKGLRLPGKAEPTPLDYAELQASIAHRLDSEEIQTMLLRSMNQAVYEPEIEGHFGLALNEYAHFTSPIRRYPDLIVHRVIKAQVASEQRKRAGFEGRKSYTDKELARLGEHCSFAERRADEASRDVNDWLKCEFMQDKVGAKFDGVVTGVTHFGLFIRLNAFFIEGLVHVSQLLNDYYHFDAQKMILLGEKSRLRFGLGDEVSVVVSRVDLDSRQIDFELIGLPNGRSSKKSIAKHNSRVGKSTASQDKKQKSKRKQASAKKQKKTQKKAKTQKKRDSKAKLRSRSSKRT